MEMATTKLGNTKSASRAINYAEKRAEEKSGLNCDVDYAKSAFKATRSLYGKEDGIQAHTVIQSFKPNEVTSEQCNQIGLELAEKIAPNHQVAVYTHTDKNHYHNHIVINSIDLETGKKYQSNKKQRDFVKQANDTLCHEHGLSVPEKQRETRYTQAEYEIGKEAQKGNKPIPWKEQIRMVIDQTQAINYEQLGTDLLQNGIKIERITEKTITYKHLEEDKKVRGSKLGEKYDKGGLERGYDGRIKSREQENTRETGPDRKATQSEWDNFADNTRKLEHDRRSSEAARLAHEKSIRDKEERERERKESQSLVRESKGFDLEL